MVGLHRSLETAEPRPEQVGKEGFQGRQAFRVDHVEATFALATDPHKPRFGKDMKVLGHRLLADVEVLFDLAHRTRLVTDQAQHGLAPGLGEGAQNRLTAHVHSFRDRVPFDQALTCTSPDLYICAMHETDERSALAVARAYHDAWVGRAYDKAWRLLDETLTVDVPINSYPTKSAFV